MNITALISSTEAVDALQMLAARNAIAAAMRLGDVPVSDSARLYHARLLHLRQQAWPDDDVYKGWDFTTAPAWLVGGAGQRPAPIHCPRDLVQAVLQ